jgi:hypothetical protein
MDTDLPWADLERPFDRMAGVDGMQKRGRDLGKMLRRVESPQITGPSDPPPSGRSVRLAR